MIRSLPLVSRGPAIAAALFVFAPMTLITAQEASPSEEEGRLLVRWALLLGDRDGNLTAPPPVGEDVVDELIEWDFRRDDEELANLFGLQSIHTMRAQADYLASTGGELTAGSIVQGTSVDVRMKVDRMTTDDGQPLARVYFEIAKEGEVLSAPTIATAFGERAMITTQMRPADDGPSPMLWVVVEIDELAD